MKKLLTAGALVTLLAVPALAQSPGADQMRHYARAGAPAYARAGVPAYARAGGSVAERPLVYPPSIDSSTVFRGGQVIGRDPDPFVRNDLGRDWGIDAGD
jgi:hypothetical protein